MYVSHENKQMSKIQNPTQIQKIKQQVLIIFCKLKCKKKPQNRTVSKKARGLLNFMIGFFGVLFFLRNFAYYNIMAISPRSMLKKICNQKATTHAINYFVNMGIANKRFVVLSNIAFFGCLSFVYLSLCAYKIR